ncbi:hypothetical protein EV188_103138 [Actinomycetospora succinea]|uniref:Small secreted domain DUF320 n=1 Tax=Actinomycetospora succinea TaxID=663603 RepID=A0A4R6VE56_9PSEU|nr:hypothetical protein [Actinomycetospora succinea]TDQ60641.1 hypothetical protein EV188_103138 [Actinomycetospora succinea]
MFRRTASIVALTGAGLLAAAPFALADPVVVDDDDPGVVVDDSESGVNLLNDLTVLPVQACGVEAGIPILSDVLSPSDTAAPDATCSVVHDGDDD